MDIERSAQTDPGMSLTRRAALSCAAGFAATAGAARAQPPVTHVPEVTPPPPAAPAAAATADSATPPEAPEDPFTLPASAASGFRFSVPVMVDGRGPFPFVVDTGADHTTLSTELADALALPRGRNVRLHSITGESIVPTARVDRLEVGSRSISDVSLALLSRAGLGAPGLLGLDAVADQRVTLDFKRREMTVRRSKGFPFDPRAIVVQAAARRSGQLLLVDTTVRSEPVFVILDTGAEVTVANTALRDLETRRRRRVVKLEQIDVISVTGESTSGFVDRIAEITLERVKMRGAPVTWADLHVFQRFGVADQPAVLLGMDVMRAFDRVEIDFGRREIGFVLPPGPATDTGDSFAFPR